MWVARGEVPQIPLFDVPNEVSSFGIESSDSGGSSEHVCPFGVFVPVQLSNCSGFKTHIDASELDRGRKLTNSGLTSQSALFDSKGISSPGAARLVHVSLDSLEATRTI